ncbi:MAG: 7-cyano-7-deazaguanine synthase [Chlorobium sp.]|uniref:7-cyano-7-deazaguanine synthase n=1 Tax=Chlorobium sp. TaxID=1095 RepID=UPI002F411D69
MTDNKKADLFWSGGWDSTYRLCELIRSGYTVQTFYILDYTRKSIRYELKAMDKIKTALSEKYPAHHKHILPTKYIDKSDIIIDTETSTRFRNISSVHHIGRQFEWLASYAITNNLSQIEIAVEKNNFRQRDPFFFYLGQHLTTISGNTVLSVECPDHDLHLFNNFSFPVFNITKIEMLADAKKHSYENIMGLTWFCHNPIYDKPCGMCSPCVDAIEEGFAYRVPKLGLIRYHIKKHHKLIKSRVNINK